jgi:hypothetical protein
MMTNKPKHPRPRRAPRVVKPGVSFAIVPHDFVVALYRWKIGNLGWLQWFEIDRLVLNSRRNPVKFTNERWQSIGGSRSAKLRALRRLEAAGVVKASVRQNQAPIITCLWRPTTHD